MKTETYLIKHEYDQNKKEMISKPCKVEMRWKIYDAFACLEIIGFKEKHETIKHLLYCHKDQDLIIMPTINDQVECADNLESVYQDRVSIDRGHDIISANDLAPKEETTYQWGLHGQLDLEDMIATKKGDN